MKTCKHCYLDLLHIYDEVTEQDTRYKVLVCPECDNIEYIPILPFYDKLKKLKYNIALSLKS